MIDLIKVYFEDKNEIEHILTKKKIMKISKYLLNDDKPIYPIRSNFKNIRLNITECNSYLENSIHKYFNNKTNRGNQNYNDFCFCDFCYACEMLEEEVGVNINDTYLTRFEFGLNIDLETINPNKFLEENILMYNYKSPCYNPKYKPNEKIKKFSLKEYEIKIYNKSLMFGLKSNILRVEVKYKTKKYFNKLGVYTLNDLKDKMKMRKVFNDFISKIKKVIIIDNYKGHLKMTEKERNNFIKYTNPIFWIELKKYNNKNTPNYHLSKFLVLINKYKLDKNRNNLINLLISKFNELINCDVNSQLLKLRA